MSIYTYISNTGKFTKGFGRCRLSCLLHYIYTVSIYPSAHKLLRRHLPNPFREFPCIKKEAWTLNIIFNGKLTEKSTAQKFFHQRSHHTCDYYLWVNISNFDIQDKKTKNLLPPLLAVSVHTDFMQLNFKCLNLHIWFWNKKGLKWMILNERKR